jgi:hypothetical protein
VGDLDSAFRVAGCGIEEETELKIVAIVWHGGPPVESVSR